MLCCLVALTCSFVLLRINVQKKIKPGFIAIFNEYECTAQLSAPANHHGLAYYYCFSGFGTYIHLQPIEEEKKYGEVALFISLSRFSM